jgi:uncharacterized repeat protein (TIGR01451 family)
MVGGTSGAAGNKIAFNGGDGVSVHSGDGNAILSNSIFSNGGLGIDLNLDGVTPNDSGDGDTGANHLQNYPILTSVVSSGGTTTIDGILNSAPNGSFGLEFFATPCEAAGFHEAQARLGSGMVTTGATGKAGFNFTFGAPLTPGQCVTATATDANNNTSELSFDTGLGIRKFDSPDPAAVGHNVTYTIEVINNGAMTGTGVTVTDTVGAPPPAGLTFISATATQGTCSNSGDTTTCSLGILAPAGGATISLVFRARGPGQVTNTATVAGNQPDPYPADNSAVEMTILSTPKS